MVTATSSKLLFGAQLRPGAVKEIVHQSILCEKNNFDSVWFPDHLTGGPPSLVWPELYTTLSMMGVNTSRVLVGSAATDSLRRHPATIAQATATLDNLTGGRIVLGIGAGEAMNLKPFGIQMSSLCGRLREAIKIIKLLWTANPNASVCFNGEFYQLTNAFLQIKPVKPPPIYVGSFGPRMLEMTGELADGWLPFSHTPETYKRCLNGPIREGAERAGRNLSEITPAFLPAVTVSKNREEAEEMITRVAKRLLLLVPSILNMVAPQVDHPGLRYTLLYWMGNARKEDRDIIARVIEEIPTEVALKTVIYGTPEDCIGQIERFAKAGCRHFIFGLRGKNWQKQIRLFGTKVISYFKESHYLSKYSR